MSPTPGLADHARSADRRRPDPDTLLEAASQEGRGRLRIFLGAAPGVGKTWEMLNAARRRLEGGTDVVAGIIETHGRTETEAAIGALPILPRREILYRGQPMPEFDLDAALARRPALLLVDELAHTNVPGARHAKRYEDVETLLAAGIDVWATLNVQHLESLNDTVARITGVRVAETLPDRVLELAHEVELIDITPAELRTRLAEGRIYRPDIAGRALAGFFREGNLGALREIALRRAAQHVDADLRDYMRANTISGPWPASERVLVLLEGDRPAAEAAVRHAKLLADSLHAPWTALLVEGTAGDAPRLAPVVQLAARLGATQAVRAGRVVEHVLDTAAREQATMLVLPRRSRTRRALERRLSDIALVIAPAPPGAGTRDRIRELAERLRHETGLLDIVLPVALVGAVVLLGILLAPMLEHEALGMLFLGVVVITASLRGLRVGLATALIGFLAWNWFFIPPVHEFTIAEPRDVIAIFVFAGVATVSGLLAGRLRQAQRAAQSRIEGLRSIGGFARALGAPTTERDLTDAIARLAAGIGAASVVLTARADTLDIASASPPADTMDEGSWAAARWAYAHAEEAGNRTGTLPSAAWRFLPMRTGLGIRGVLGVQPPPDGLDATAAQTLASLADQAAVAIERIDALGDAARAEAGAETQRLRTALLNSLSHDLRTPLTGIQGAAGTLRSAWDALDDPTRRDLLAAIEEDTARMARFLGNVMDMTRLESGQITPRADPCILAHAVEGARARVPAAVIATADIPAALAVTADPVLLEQVLVNVLDNAVRYAPPGSPLALRATAGGDTVSLTVADEGAGIPPAELELVFDSFYRARRGDRTAPGTGLGLAIARGLVEAMGGTINAASPRARTTTGLPGTEITIRLPRAPA